jgi:hypothetical protein
MMQKAESHGLSFRSEVALDGDALKAPIIDSYHSFGEGLYAMVSSPLYRTIGQEPDVRENGTHINASIADLADVLVAGENDRWFVREACVSSG